MHAEIIAIGTEILLGEIVDTNSATIAKKLQSIGMHLHYTSTVGDNLDRIVTILKHGIARSDLVAVTTTCSATPAASSRTSRPVADPARRSTVIVLVANPAARTRSSNTSAARPSMRTGSDDASVVLPAFPCLAVSVITAPGTGRPC